MPSRHERRQRHEPEPTFSFKRVTDAIAAHPKISSIIAASIGVPILLGGYVLSQDGGENPVATPTSGIGRPLGLEPPTPTLEQARDTSRAAFVKKLEGFFDFPPTITRTELAKKLYPITYVDQAWKTNITLGSLINKKGQAIQIKTGPDGEAIPAVPIETKTVAYPTENPQKTILKMGNNYLVVYGTKETITKFQNEHAQQIAQRFIAEYFGDLPIKTNVLHLNFLPSTIRVIYDSLGEGLEEYTPQIDSNSIATTASLRNNNTGFVERGDIIIKIPYLHQEQASLQLFSINEDLQAALGNEMGNLLPNTFRQNQEMPNPNEAPSTMLGYLAGLDERWARLLLGGDAYKEFLKIVAQEMERIGRVKN